MSPEAGMNTPLEAVRCCIEQLDATIGVAHRLVKAGKTIDLTGFQEEVGFVCARALDLPPNEGRTLRLALSKLLQAAEALNSALSAHAPPTN